MTGLTLGSSHGESESRSVVSNSLRSHGPCSPWNSLGQNTEVGSLSLLQGIFPTPGLNPGIPHYCGFFTSWATGKPKSTGVGSLSLLQQIFLTQESNWSLLHCRCTLYQLSYQGSPPISEATWKLWCEKSSLTELRNHLFSHHGDQTQDSAGERLGQLLSSCFSAPNPLYSDAGRLWKPHFCFANCSLRVSARGRQSPEEWGRSKARNFLSASRFWEHHPRLTAPPQQPVPSRGQQSSPVFPALTELASQTSAPTDWKSLHRGLRSPSVGPLLHTPK